MLSVISYGSPEDAAFRASMADKRRRNGQEVSARVAEILADVRANGWDAVTRWSVSLDKAGPREIPLSELDAAAARLDSQVLADLQRAADNIYDYQRRVVPESRTWTSPDGAVLGQLIHPLSRVGLYVPGGTAAYPSSLLMTAVPAKAAGVPEIIMVTPPTAFMKDEVLAAAKIAGVTRAFAVGGVQAIAALAFGTEPVPRADKIAGPGNAYVQEAKRQLFGEIDIDSIAGPSDVLVLADDSARPDWVAADLLSQAEHGELSAAHLVTASEPLIRAVCAALEEQLAAMPRAAFARKALQAFGGAFLCRGLDECIDCANELAPEHLEVILTDLSGIPERLVNCGALFAGAWTAEPVGDYIAGPSHVLPTDGTARFFSPLSAEGFVKRRSLLEFDRASFLKCAEAAARMADREELYGHAESLRRRLR